MRVVIVGAGRMGAQIGCEYALGGHDVALVARDAGAALARAEAGFALLLRHELLPPAEVEAARERLTATADLDAVTPGCDLAVESVPEDLALKGLLLRRVAAASPQAVLATNTSSLRVTAIGEAAGAPERTVATHYWNPPLLMPLVEIVGGERTSPDVVAFARDTVASLGKRPIVVDRDVPGFIWNRLQYALVREIGWIVSNGVAAPDVVDTVVRDGLARRYRYIGPFETIALGGLQTWDRMARNILPTFSDAQDLSALEPWADAIDEPDAILARRDRGLAGELVRESRRERV